MSADNSEVWYLRQAGTVGIGFFGLREKQLKRLLIYVFI